MKKSDFYYDLPPELIAQTPLERRDGSRMMTLDRKTGAVAHRHFYELPALLRRVRRYSLRLRHRQHHLR